MSLVFEEKPRFNGAPKYCIAESRPAFESIKEAVEYLERNCPSFGIKKTWKCGKCGWWHYEARPSGDALAELPADYDRFRKPGKRKAAVPEKEKPKTAEKEQTLFL